MLFGTLTLSANQAPQFALPLGGIPTARGHHVSGRYSGSWETAENAYNKFLYLPHRDKEISIDWSNDAGTWAGHDYDMASVFKDLSELDAQYEGLTQLEKYRRLLDAHKDLCCAMVLNTRSAHGSFALLSFGSRTLNVIGVYDPQLGASHLVWSAEETSPDALVRRCREVYPLRFLFYRFPVVLGDAVLS